MQGENPNLSNMKKNPSLFKACLAMHYVLGGVSIMLVDVALPLFLDQASLQFARMTIMLLIAISPYIFCIIGMFFDKRWLLCLLFLEANGEIVSQSRLIALGLIKGIIFSVAVKCLLRNRNDVEHVLLSILAFIFIYVFSAIITATQAMCVFLKHYISEGDINGSRIISSIIVRSRKLKDIYNNIFMLISVFICIPTLILLIDYNHFYIRESNLVSFLYCIIGSCLLILIYIIFQYFFMNTLLLNAEIFFGILDDDATTRKELQRELNTGQITSIKLIFMQLPFIYWIVFGLLFRYMGISV